MISLNSVEDGVCRVDHGAHIENDASSYLPWGCFEHLFAKILTQDFVSLALLEYEKMIISQ